MAAKGTTPARRTRTVGQGATTTLDNMIDTQAEHSNVSTANGPTSPVIPGTASQNFSDDIVTDSQPNEQLPPPPPAPVPEQQPVKKVMTEDLLNMSRGVNTSGEARKGSSNAVTLILRKIPKGSFRLGLERQEEPMQLMPGAVHKFEPYRSGNVTLTALNDDPKERKRLESILNVDLGPESSYYFDITYPMTDRPHGHFMTLDDTPQGAYEAVVYYCMIASPLVSNGIHEYQNGKKPMAEWYVENKEAEAAAESIKVDTDLKMFEMLAIMPDSRRVEIAKIMNIPDCHTGSPTLIKTSLFKTLKTGTKLITAEDASKRFMIIASWDDLKIGTAALIEDAIEANLIRQNRNKDYHYNDEVLGLTKEEVLATLMTPRYSQTKVSIMDRINHKKH